MAFAVTSRRNLLQRLRSARDESGATLVEVALSIVILLVLLFGIMETAFAVYSYHFISEAAREGTRYAIVRGNSFTTDCTAPGDATCTAQGGSNAGDIATYVENIGFPGIDPGNMTVNSTWFTSSGGTCTPPSDLCKSPGNQVQVQVQYAFPLRIPFIPFSTINMSSTSQMIISQ